VLSARTLVAGLSPLFAVVAATRQVVTHSSLEHAQADVTTAREPFMRLVSPGGLRGQENEAHRRGLPIFRIGVTNPDDVDD